MRSATTTADPARLPNDPGTSMTYAADEIVAEWRRAWVLRQLGNRVKILDPLTNPLILARVGHSRQSIVAQADLLRKARKGDDRARRVLRERFACTVWQRQDLPQQTPGRRRRTTTP